LPKDFPPKSTTWRYFDEWRHNGTFDTIHDALRTKVRTQEKPNAPRTTASVDSQSVDTWGLSPGAGQRQERGRAFGHIVVDSMGLLLAVLVTAASVDDAQAAQDLVPRLDGQPVGKVRRVFADNKYHNYALYEWVEDNAEWELVIVRRPEGQKGWVKLPLRWTVERTFAWLGKCRRLTKDRERSVLSSEAFVKLAMIHLMLNRLKPKETDAEFHYRLAA
jgi:putative transposase